MVAADATSARGLRRDVWKGQGEVDVYVVVVSKVEVGGIGLWLCWMDRLRNGFRRDGAAGAGSELVGRRRLLCFFFLSRVQSFLT